MDQVETTPTKEQGQFLIIVGAVAGSFVSTALTRIAENAGSGGFVVITTPFLVAFAVVGTLHLICAPFRLWRWSRSGSKFVRARDKLKRWAMWLPKRQLLFVLFLKFTALVVIFSLIARMAVSWVDGSDFQIALNAFVLGAAWAIIVLMASDLPIAIAEARARPSSRA